MRPKFSGNLNYDDLRSSGRVPRVHGNGFLQLDLNDEGTSRLHIWSDFLPRQKVATPIHDHVFALRSEVILGTLIHEEMEFRWVIGTGSHRVYHAQQEPGTQNTILVPDSGEVTPQITQKLILSTGSVYTFPAWTLHQSNNLYGVLTATVMEKIDAPKQYGRPRVLVPVGQEPDNQFRRDGFDTERLWEFVEEVLTQL